MLSNFSIFCRPCISI